MKGTTSVNPIFEQIQIHNPTIHIETPLLCTDNHSLFYKSANVRIPWEHKSIINACYCQKYGTLIILSEQGKLHIFTENLNQIARIPWESKYSVGLEYLETVGKNAGRGYFLMIGATDVQVQYVKVFSNVKSTKFVSSMNFAIQKKQKYIAQPQTKLQWNKGYNYNIKQNILYLWSSKDINFYQLDNLQLKSKIVSLTRKDMSITYVLYNTTYKYTITGLINGHIKVWRLPANSGTTSTNKDYILIHKYIQHTKPVDKIIQGQDQRIIISNSEEMIVCLWSLETFQLLRMYDFMGEYTRIGLVDWQYSWALKDGTLGKLKYGKNLQFITDITSQIISIGKYRKQLDIENKSPIQSMQLTLSSNLGFQIREDQLNAKDLNKIQIQYIYPPLKAKGILQILSSPYTPNQYFLLVQSGQIFRLRIELNSGKIQESYSIERTKDIELHQLNQAATHIKFLSLCPPQYDSQINQNVIDKKQKKQEKQIGQQFKELKLITIGCSKGTIVFIRIQEFQNIYTRVTYHREAIVCLEGFKCNGYQYLVSLCVEKYMRIIKFDNQKATCLLSLYTADSISIIKGLQDRLVLVLKKGFFQIFKLNAQQKDYCLHSTTATVNQNHEQQILAIDEDPSKRLLLTAALDNKIKIWTYQKIQIYEIILDQGLKNAIWFRPFQLLISHNLKLLYFRNIGLKITEAEIDDLNEEFLESGQYENMSIQESLKNMKILRQEVKFQMLDTYKDIPKLPELKQKQSVAHKKSIRQKHIEVPKQLNNSYISEQSPKRVQKQKQKQKTERVQKPSQQRKKRKSYIPQQQQAPKARIPDSDLQATRKHVDDINELRKHTNESILPKIKPKSEDAFDNFMRSKLINKKILTRRDITLNRIIMKNIIKQHFGADSDITSHLKLDF